MHNETFRTLLRQMDPAAMAQHSVLNHHAEGVDYICLHRTPTLTAKLYLIEQPRNPNSGFLVHPHSHRYAFTSTVLCGGLRHIRFFERDGVQWQRHTYRAENRSREATRLCGLHAVAESHVRGHSYFVAPHEIHTLQMLPRPVPLLIGLLQFSDEQPESDLYLPAGQDEMLYPDSRVPTAEDMRRLRARALELLGCPA